MNLLILKGYNNYFNRIHRRVYKSTRNFLNHINELIEFGNDIGYYNFEVQDFDYADGITTEVIIGNEQQQDLDGIEPQPIDWRMYMPDYLIVHHYTPSRIIVFKSDIDSRWFVINCTKIRGGQYKLTLKRDVISDFLQGGEYGGAEHSVDNELPPTIPPIPALIKKGYVDGANPLVLNTENITVNQIKKDEILVQDNSKTPWIVGYMAKDTGVSDTVTVQITPEAFSNYITIEDLADDLHIDASILKQVLDPKDSETPTYFLDNNVEIVGWVNDPDDSPMEYKVLAGSYNNLQSFTSGYINRVSHNPTSDCFAKLGTARGPSPQWPQWREALNNNIVSIRNNWESYTQHPLLTRDVYNRLHSMTKTNNKDIVLVNGTYYYIVEKSTVPQGGNRYEFSKMNAPFETVCSEYITLTNTAFPSVNLSPLAGGTIYLYCNEIRAVFALERITDSSVIPGATLSMSSTRYGLVNEPYDMFALPLNSIKAVDGTTEYELQGDYAQKLAIQIAKKYDKAIYDIQLLPYCPLQDNNTGTILRDNTIVLDNLREGYDYNWITENSVTLTRRVQTEALLPRPLPSPGTQTNFFQVTTSIDNSTITNITYEIIANEDKILTGLPLIVNHNSGLLGTSINTSSFTWDWTGNTEDIPIIQFTITFTQQDYPTSIIIYPKTNSSAFTIDKKLELTDDMKIENICTNYRLVSPNYQGSFDFNVAKNGGQVNGFTVDFTYKPYTPYIRVAPVFDSQWLYGGDWNDCRGLICGGDFSIGLMNSAWESYQLNNKNYQNIFNREIQNLDVNQQLQMQKMTFQDVVAIPTGAIGGAKTGAKTTGSAYGAIAGAVVGAGTTAAGAVLDNYWINKEQIEQRQYAIDKYKLSLGNIQALPYTLTKIGAFNINSKIWPFLEYYTCTDEEKEAVKQKIHYEGMNLGVVGYISDYIDTENGSFIQADLIRTFDAYWYEDHYIDPEDDEEGYIEEGMLNTEAIANAIYSEFTKGIFWYSNDDADKFDKEIWYEDSDDEGE